MVEAPSSLTEFIVAIDNVRFTGTLGAGVQVSVPYLDTANDGYVDGTNPPVPDSSLRLYYLNENMAQWEAVPGSVVDQGRKVVTAQVSHLSIFSAFGTPVTISNATTTVTTNEYGSLASARIYPVPYKPNGGNPDQGKPYSAGDPTSGIIFDRLPEPVSITIYSVTGQEVVSLTYENPAGMIRWDARNGDGRDVATGLYLAVLKSPGQGTITKKLLIIR
jgi:hypothetical protein